MKNNLILVFEKLKFLNRNFPLILLLCTIQICPPVFTGGFFFFYFFTFPKVSVLLSICKYREPWNFYEIFSLLHFSTPGTLRPWEWCLCWSKPLWVPRSLFETSSASPLKEWGFSRIFNKNYNKKRDFRVPMVLAWLCGDVAKTVYFVVTGSPLQFWICAIIQV